MNHYFKSILLGLFIVSATTCNAQQSNTELSDSDISQVEASLEKYRKEATIGKSAMLVGALTIGASMIIQSLFDESNKDARTLDDIKGPVPVAVPLAGTLILTYGIALDLNALSHLKKKR